jgi:hypothetical protein
MQSRYDPSTAVTFLLAGLGLGAVLALVLAPRPEYGPVGSSYFKPRERERDLQSAGTV